jgi:predicted TIM-barrel fold metal-dependent hydrolase
MCPTQTRRQFLSTAAALGAGAILSAQSGRDSNVRLIDVHHHCLPDFWKKATDIPNAWSLEMSLAQMDRYGVATSILSYTAPGVWTGNVQQDRDLARRSNEFAAKLVSDHPGRFGLFAAIPLPDSDGSLKEIEYAMDTLKADGIGLISNYSDKWLGDPSYAPVFEELNRRKIVVYTHPGGHSFCGNLVPNVRPQVAEFPHDTTRMVMNLVFSGTLAKYRDVKIILSHGGGTVPYLAGRIIQMSGQQKNLPQIAPQGIEAELKRLYYEIACNTHPASMAALMKLAPREQIMFGTDYPFFQVGVTADGLKNLGLADAEFRTIAHENAGQLLPKWKV